MTVLNLTPHNHILNIGSRNRFSSDTGNGIVPWLGIAAIVVLLDQITKIAITQAFTYGESHPITSFFNLVLVYNKGAAFSFLANQGGWQRYFFTAIGIAAALFIICGATAVLLGIGTDTWRCSRQRHRPVNVWPCHRFSGFPCE